VVAAVVARAGAVVTAQDLRDFAFANVTDYKVPSRVLLVAAIPRTPNGKARRRELGHALGLDERPAYASPVDERERSIADAFGDVLKLDAVGRFDNFFALGGDSLRSSQVAARVSRLYGCNVSGATLFRRPTVAEFAAEVVRVMRDHGALVPPPIVPLPRGSRP
jgi:hypothetical protein